MANDILKITDASLTDGQDAIWGDTLSTPATVRLVTLLGSARLDAIEVLSPAVIAGCLARGEDPWQRIRDIRAHAPGTKLRASLNPITSDGIHGLDVLPQEVLNSWISRLSQAGIDEVLVMDPMLNAKRLQAIMASIKASGMRSIAVLPFINAADNDALLDTADLLKDTGAEAIQLRDEAGVLSAERLAELVPQLKARLGDLPISLHIRCVTGLGPMVAFEAVRLGIRELDTALPTLANGPSLPSSLNLLRGMPAISVTAAGPDAGQLDTAENWLAELAAREDLTPSTPWNFDLAPYIHNLTGTAARQAYAKLQKSKAWHQLHDFSRECAAITQELGNVPLIAPFANAIAQQALWNINAKARWTRIHPVLRRVVQGVYSSQHTAPNQALAIKIGRISPDKNDTPFKCSLTEKIGGMPMHINPPKTYVETTPLEALTYGLLAHLQNEDGFSFIDVTDPDAQIQLHLNRGSHV
jgi:oxaloacetate decarboxylase alpha subunit